MLDEAGRYDQAEPLIRRNLEECSRALGPGDGITLEAEYQLGDLLGHLHKLDEAERVFRDIASRVNARLWAPRIEQTLRSINQLGLLLQDRGKLDEAYSLADEYERGVKCLWGTKHPDNVGWASLARVRLSQGQLDVAELLYESAAGEAERIFGADHRGLSPRRASTRASSRRTASRTRPRGCSSESGKPPGAVAASTTRRRSRPDRGSPGSGSMRGKPRKPRGRARGPPSLRGDPRARSPDHPGSSRVARARPSGEGGDRFVPAEPDVPSR